MEIIAAGTDNNLLLLDDKNDTNINSIAIGKYRVISNFYKGLARVINKDNKFGYINVLGKEIIPCQYDNAFDLHRGIIAVRSNNKWGGFNLQGKMVVPCKYKSLHCIHNISSIKINRIKE